MKVCFVGSGSIGRRHMLNLYSLCVKRQEHLIIHVLRSCVGKNLSPDLAAIVDKELFSVTEMDSFYDALFICNPTYKHYTTITELQNRSHYFFVEKPVFERSDYRIEDLRLPKENQYYVACPLRYSSVLMRAREILKDKKVISAQAISSSYLPNWREGVDYRQTYSANREQGGGVKIDLIHEWDYLVELFGYPDKVFSFAGKYSDLEITSDDIAVYIAQYADKLLELHLDYFGVTGERYLRVWTSSEEYVFDVLKSCVYRNGECIERYEEDRNEMYIREMEYFMEFVNGNCQNNNSLEHALKVMGIAENVK